DLVVAGPSTADSANVHQWDWFGIPNQEWRFEAVGDGAHRIIARHSGKACDVAWASWANGANVQQLSVNGAAAQEWWLQPVGEGYCKIVNRETGRVLDVANLSLTNGANVQQWDYVGGHNQQWRIEQVVAPPAPPIPAGLHAVAGGERVTLFWNASTNTTSYNLKRANISGGTYVTVATNVMQSSICDTGLTAGTAYYYVVSAMNGTTESGNSTEVGVIPWTVVQARNSGGAAVLPFSSDANVVGGTAAATTAVIDTAGLTNPAPPAVYQSERYGNMTYTLPGLPMGVSHRVRLHFAETYWSAAGQRRFHVSINGASVLSNFDVWAAAGAKNRAVIREFNVLPNASGQIVIQLSSVVDNATLAGVEIVRAPVIAPPTLSVNLSGAHSALVWPASATAFNLYTTTNLAPPVNWLPVTNPPVMLGSNRSVTLPISGGLRFFRLATP
ncbi:MAG: RICIN domain-containing protein, partial [Verrucomicrobiota bacterium]